jgi:subtilisin family serine protease
LARGVLYAVDYGADIINLSLGAPTTSQTLEAAIAYAVDRGVVVVAAGGNFSAEMAFYPAALSGVIGVGATTSQDTHWRRSNSGSHIDLTAPGDLIYSAYHLADNTLQGYTYMSGTSMATPFVSGLAGLALSLQPSLTPVEVSAALAAGADDLGPPGWDPEFGHGRINAARALTAAAAARPLVDGTPAAAPVRVFLPAIVAR